MGPVSSLPLISLVVLKSYSALMLLVGQAHLGAQREASTDNVGVEHFQGTWAVWFSSQSSSPSVRWGQFQGMQ